MSTSHDAISTLPAKLTYDDYAQLPDDGMRHEIIGGIQYTNAAPHPHHQFVSRHIQFQLFQQIELTGLGEVINAPIDLLLGPHDVVQPDILVVLNQNRIITEKLIGGVPDLVIEILSPSNRSHDERRKLQLYEQSQVPEFWIVDPLAHSVEQYVLGDNHLFLPPETRTDQVIYRGIPGNATVDLTRVW